MRPANLSRPDSIKLVALALSFLLLSAPPCLAQSLSEINDDLPQSQSEDLSGSKVTFCSQPLNVNGDHRYFFFVDKAEEDEQIELFLTKGQIEFIEPLNPAQFDKGRSQDRVNWQGRTITIKGTTSFILHAEAASISLAAEDKSVTLASTSKCAQLTGSVAYSNQAGKQEYIDQRIRPLESVYNVTENLMRLRADIRHKSCSRGDWYGVKDDSVLCAANDLRSDLWADLGGSKLDRGGEPVSTREIARTYVNEYSEEYNNFVSRFNLKEMAEEHGYRDLDPYIHQQFSQNYLNFLQQQVSDSYQKSFERWHQMRQQENFEELSHSYKTLTDVAKFLTTEKIFAQEGTELMTFEELLNHRFEDTSYSFEVVTERPRIDFGQVTITDPKTRTEMHLLPEKVFSRLNLKNRMQTLPRLNIYDQSGELAQASYIFPLRELEDMQFSLDADEVKVPAELEGKLGVIGINLVDGHQISSWLPKALVHESIHSLGRASGYNDYYNARISEIYGAKGSVQAKTEYKMMMEGPTMALTPEIMSEYTAGLERLGWEGMGLHFLSLEERINHVSPTKAGHNSGYFISEFLFKQAMEENGLSPILNHKIDLIDDYDIPGSIKNFRTFANKQLAMKADEFDSIRSDYRGIMEDLMRIYELWAEDKRQSKALEQQMDQVIDSLDEEAVKEADINPNYQTTPEETFSRFKSELELLDKRIKLINLRKELGVFSQKTSQQFIDLNSRIRDTAQSILDKEKIRGEEIEEILGLRNDIRTNLEDLGYTKMQILFHDLQRITTEMTEEGTSDYYFEGDSQEIAGRLQSNLEDVENDIEGMRDIGNQDVETGRILKTLNTAENSALRGKLDTLTSRRSLWGRAKEIAIEQVKKVEFGDFAPVFSASAAEALAQSLRDFGNTYDLAWTSWVAGGLHVEALSDYTEILAGVLAPKVLWGLSYMIYGQIGTGLVVIGEAVTYFLGMMLLTALLIGVLTFVLTPLIYLLGMHIMRSMTKARLLFTQDKLKRFKTTKFLLAGMKGLENYPIGKKIGVTLTTNESESEIKSASTSCQLVKTSGQKIEGRKTCLGEVKLPFSPGKQWLKATYRFTKVPNWFDKVATRLGSEEGKISLRSPGRTTFLSVSENQICVQMRKQSTFSPSDKPYYHRECAPLSHPIGTSDYQQSYVLLKPSAMGTMTPGVYKLWVEEEEVKCGLFDLYSGRKLADCNSQGGKLPAGEQLSKQTKARQVRIQAAEGKLRARLELKTEQGQFTSNYFDPLETQVLGPSDFAE